MSEAGSAEPTPAPDEEDAQVAPDERVPAAKRARHRQSRNRRRLGWAMIAVGGLILLAGIYLVITALLVRRELEHARNDVADLRRQLAADQLDQARHTLRDLREHADRAHDLSTGPVWAAAAALPAGGEPIETVRGVAAAVDALARTTLPALLDARASIDPATLRRSDGSIDLGPIVAVQPALRAADAALQHARARVAGLPGDTWLSSVDSARRKLLGEVGELARTVHSADLGAQLMPRLLGNDGPRRYFVAFQNEAEARGTGGLPGVFGIAEADHGRIRFLRFETDGYLDRTTTDLDLGADYTSLYGAYEPTQLFVNSNVSPHFPYAARIWAAMWQKKTGERLDGALALDPSALSYLLAATGPAVLHDGTQVSAGNVVSLVSSTAYQRFPDTAARKAFLVALARAVSDHLVGGAGSASALVDAAARALGERRIQVWSSDAADEALLQQTAASGAVPVTSSPLAAAWLTNEAGNKLDYYVSGSMRWQRQCGTRRVDVTVTLTNSTPASGLPDYVTVGTDQPRPEHLGDTRDYLNYAATTGAVLDTVTVDGKAVTASSGVDRGHPVYTVDLHLPRGQSRTVVFHLVEPAGTGAPIVLRQPLVHPLTVSIADAVCG